MPQSFKTPRIAVILAGGEGRRMGGADKGALVLCGRRLIEIVCERIKPQIDRVLISGSHDYGTGLTYIPDCVDGPAGPSAGLWAALAWIKIHVPAAEGFLTAPVDGPFMPEDLYARLSEKGASAFASVNGDFHPTFAYWRCDALRAAFSRAPRDEAPSLKELGARVNAIGVEFSDATAFHNINTPDDLARAEKLLTP